MFPSFMSSERRKDLCVSLDMCWILGPKVSEEGKNDVFYIAKHGQKHFPDSFFLNYKSIYLSCYYFFSVCWTLFVLGTFITQTFK